MGQRSGRHAAARLRRGHQQLKSSDHSMQLKRKVALALLAALSFAAPAFAHVPARELAPAIDLRHARVTAQEPVQPFHIVPGHLFADVAHVEEPAASLSTTLAERFAAENLNHERPHALRLTRAVSQNLTSGLRESLRRAIIREINGLGPETRWAEGYVRERWYDPERGSWLSPDPLGNRDSANLYAFGSGDPVNGRDPTGSQSRPDFTPDERRQMQKQYAREIASLRESCERDELSDACIGMLGTILGDVSPEKFKAGERYAGDSTLLINGVLLLVRITPDARLGLTLVLAWLELIIALAGAFLIVNERASREG